MLNVAILGYGGIAKAHQAAYASLAKKGAPVRLVALCDTDPEQFSKNIAINLGEADISGTRDLACYTDLDKMLAEEKLDIIDICLPTFLHAEYAVKLLEKGYHVQSEKPMARTYQQCQDMLAAAKKSGRQLMIGQCLRFYPQYEFLKDLIEKGTYGKVISAFMQRYSGPPIWAWENWFMDYKRSGGCLLDMHIHDLDMARHLFGEPETVACRSQDVRSGQDIVYSQLHYPDLPVTAIGDWSLDGTPFHHGYRISFEKASVIFDSATVMVYPRSGEPFQADLAYEEGGIEREIAYFANIISSGQPNLKNPPESAAASVKLAETLLQSSKAGGRQLPFTR